MWRILRFLTGWKKHGYGEVLMEPSLLRIRRMSVKGVTSLCIQVIYRQLHGRFHSRMESCLNIGCYTAERVSGMKAGVDIMVSLRIYVYIDIYICLKAWTI